jgi:hypothetical protein
MPDFHQDWLFALAGITVVATKALVSEIAAATRDGGLRSHSLVRRS